MNSSSSQARLLAIVEVDYDQRVRCQEPGCNHAVYRAIHVVRDGDMVLVLGSTCYAKRFGSGKALGNAQFTVPGAYRQLSAEERQLLLDNTQELLARFESEALARAEATRLRLEAMRARFPAPAPIAPPTRPVSSYRVQVPGKGTPPWPWMKPRTSMAYFRLRDGAGWVRVQHAQGHQMLAPYPVFDGWDEALPPKVGKPDLSLVAYRVEDVPATVSYLRGKASRHFVTGVWGDILKEAS